MKNAINTVCLVLPLIALSMVTAHAKDVSLTDNVYFITEQLILPAGPNQSWKWSGFESLPTNGMYEQKPSSGYDGSKSRYSLSRGIVKNKSIEVGRV